MEDTRDGAGTARTEGTLEELRRVLKDFDTAMLSTITPGGFIRARPMAMQDPAAMTDCDLWFVTADDSPKAGEIERDDRVGVVCYRPRDRAYVSVSATARFSRDRAAIERLWKPDWKAWFPSGKDDPHIALVKLTVQLAEYWEPEGGRLRVLYSVVKNLLQGESAAKDINPPKHVSR